MPAMVANNGNAMTLWNAGLIAATNVPITANFKNSPMVLVTDPPNSATDDMALAFVGPGGGMGQWTTPILHNVAMKGGYNAIRVFFELNELDFKVPVQHEISILADLGRTAEDNHTAAKTAWYNDTLLRVQSISQPETIPRYDLLAAQIDNILEQSAQLGMGVILSLGTFYSGEAGALWSDQELQDDLVMFWKLTAQRWVGHHALIGYELLNEPVPGMENKPSMPKSKSYSDMNQPGNLDNYKALMERCVAEIRLSDQTTPIIVSSPSLGDPGAIDYFMGASSTDNSQLIHDPSTLGERIVYTVHCYAPFRYTHQGIRSGTFHAIGLCYPNLIGWQYEDRNGQAPLKGYDFRNQDIASGGMAQIFANVAKFRRDYNRPVFVGEFSACSSALLERLSTGTALWLDGQPTSVWQPTGSVAEITRSDPSRAVVGMHYDSVKQEGILIMRGAIALYDNTSESSGKVRNRNMVDLKIDPLQKNNSTEFEDPSTLQGWGDLGTLTDVVLDGVWYGYDDDMAVGNANCLIRFPWPAGKSAPAATSLGLPLTKPDPVTGLPVLKTPEEIMAYISAAAENVPNIASINIMLSEARVKAQEASRVVYARDVLRQCAQLGLSWAWFADDDLVNEYPHGAYYWQVDSPIMPLAGANGTLRALLRRSAHQSYEV